MSEDKNDFLESIRNREKRRPDPIEPEGYVKAKVATHYLTDSEQLCLRARTTINSSDLPFRYSMRSKIFVEILMSFECSLKSLVISLSKGGESPEQAYHEAREPGHRVGQLCEKVKNRSYNRLKFVSSKEEDMIYEAEEIGVFVRYELEAMRLKRGLKNGRLFSKPNKLLQTIRSEQWMSDMLELGFKLHSIAYESGSRYMSEHLSMMGSDVEEAHERLQKFIDSALD
jgi:hypothetical protein